MLKLEELKSAYDNTSPATQIDLFAEREGSEAYGVEPGDMTHYTVRIEGQCAIAYVGNFDSLPEEALRERALIAIQHPYRNEPLFLNKVQGNSYQQEILQYLAALALNCDYEEPEGLAHRRSYATKKED